jgi:polyisoprenoid-binding protein YceI
MAKNVRELVRYRVDPSQSRFTVQAFAEGLLSAFGHNPLIAVCGFGGQVQFIPGTLESASVLILVRADSLTVVDAGSEKDRAEIERVMREEVLEAERYPEIAFIRKDVMANRLSENVFQVRFNGNLSLHGVTRPLPIDARVTLNESGLRANGEVTLRQTDYNIKLVSALGGTLRVKDDVKVSFDIAAHQ